MTTAKENAMRYFTMTCLAVAAALSGCTHFEIDNEPPVAVATISANGVMYDSEEGIEAGTATSVEVTLSGAGSFDPDESGGLTYRWIRTDIAQADRHGVADGNSGEAGTSQSITVSLPVGKHRFSLWVTDGDGGVSAPASVTVSILSAAACISAYEALIPDNPTCAECLCTLTSEGGCRDQVTTCFANSDEAFTTGCLAVVGCAGMTGCSGAACYTADTCMAELDMATADYTGFPGGCTDFGPTEAPCPAATAFGECQAMNCADACM